MPCQMLLWLNARGKVEGAGVYCALLRLGPQVAHRVGVVGQQPEHAVGDGVQDVHPQRKARRQYFVVVVEAAIDKAVRWQAQVLARAGGFSDGAGVVVGLVAVRQVGHALRQVGAAAWRHHDRVGDQVVDIGRRQGSGVAQVTHLYRGAAQGEYAAAGVLGVATQVHRDVDFHRACKLRYLHVAHGANVNEAVKGGR